MMTVVLRVIYQSRKYHFIHYDQKAISRLENMRTEEWVDHLEILVTVD